jgi:hypothetical protein
MPEDVDVWGWGSVPFAGPKGLAIGRLLTKLVLVTGVGWRLE